MCECEGCRCPTGTSRREGDTDRSPVLHQSQYNAAVYHQGWEEREGEEEEERQKLRNGGKGRKKRV